MALFDLEPPPPPTCSKRQAASKRLAIARITKMHTMYGDGPPDTTCRTCTHFLAHRFSRIYFKCRLFGDTASESTDWRARWPACGKFVAR